MLLEIKVYTLHGQVRGENVKQVLNTASFKQNEGQDTWRDQTERMEEDRIRKSASITTALDLRAKVDQVEDGNEAGAIEEAEVKEEEEKEK